ncbi:MAG TPA: TetR/AcrR family transcriptional regulator [Ktedonobacterales bacterium]
MSRSTDPQARQAMRERFLRAAAQEFAQTGYEAANINVISEQAGAGKGTIYLYFPSKRDLFLALLQAIAERQLAVVRAALEQRQTLAEQLEALYLAFAHLAIEDTEGFQVYMSTLYGVNRAFQQEATRLLHEYVSLLSAILTQALPDHRFEPSWVKTRALWLFSATESLVLTARVLGWSEQHLVALAPTIAGLLLRSVAGE